jgi:hypothetical protein
MPIMMNIKSFARPFVSCPRPAGARPMSAGVCGGLRKKLAEAANHSSASAFLIGKPGGALERARAGVTR